MNDDYIDDNNRIGETLIDIKDYIEVMTNCLCEISDAIKESNKKFNYIYETLYDIRIILQDYKELKKKCQI